MLIGFLSFLLLLFPLLAKHSRHSHDENGFELRDLERGDRVLPVVSGYDEGGYLSVLNPIPSRPQPAIAARAKRRMGVFGHDSFSGHHLRRISMPGEAKESQRDLLGSVKEMGAGTWIQGSNGNWSREDLKSRGCPV
ncbi:hypothetical protein BGZ60DRAFT_410180 [Tricladium varicosporioides]|nr:hypothetical protein BGZ60DRAFT_410180 [Hymenoscyphus varicosporioides]